MFFINNQLEIAACQCEQKDVPENCCPGTCGLTKEMKKTATPAETQKERSESNSVASLVVVEAFIEEKEGRMAEETLKNLFPDPQPHLA